ncbi:MAG: TonB-dependent receptor plug domain-containing protein [Phycisphaerales bacterium]|nr:MAG: TonB-dependent receptor plug domain-containing protein [Phycisphaerales bacterium]
MMRLSAVRVVVAFSMLLAVTAWGAELNLPDEAEGHVLPDVTVSAPSEPDFTTLPQRDLMARPYTESPGLETATSVVGRKEIEEMHAYSVVDAMKYLPGAWTETRGRKVKSFYSVRGQRYPYPGYLIDGAWFREFHEINYYLSAANFDRIEVLRSSSALLAGPGGMTGMINLVPRTYDERETRFEGLYGTHNTFRSDLTHGDVGVGYNYGVSAGYLHTDGPSNMNATENMTNLFGRFEYQLADDVAFSWSQFGLLGDRELMLAVPPADTPFITRVDQFDPMRTYVTVAKLRYEPTSESATEVLANYGGRRFSWERKNTFERLEEDYEYGTSVIQSQKLTENNTLRLGGLFNRWITPTGKRFYWGNPADIRTYSGVIVDDHDFGRLDTSIGYRYTREHWKEFGGFNVEGTAGSLRNVQVDDEWSDPLHTGNLGASYELTTDVSLFGNIGWGQIAARPGMLTQDGSDYRMPDTENRWKFDLGARRELERWGQASLTGFFVRQDNTAIVTNNTVTVNDEEVALFEEADRKNYGVELDLRSRRFENGLQFFFNATAMETERTRDGDWEDDEEVPNLILGGGVSYLIDRFEMALFANHLNEYENERFLPAGSAPVPLGDFTEINGVFTYHCDPMTDLYVKVDNITDDEYSTVAGYPHDGTQVYAGVVKRF